jgi:hypothetical protein
VVLAAGCVGATAPLPRTERNTTTTHAPLAYTDNVATSGAQIMVEGIYAKPLLSGDNGNVTMDFTPITALTAKGLRLTTPVPPSFVSGAATEYALIV